LISAIGVMDDAMKRVSMDVKEEGNLIYVLGETFNELGGSHYLALHGFIGNSAPQVNADKAVKLYNALSKATNVGESNAERMVRACHDCSEGGLGVALAEMAFAGMKGIEVDLDKVVLGENIERADYILFSESNSRFVVEVPERFKQKFEELMKDNAFALIGRVVPEQKLKVNWQGKKIIQSDLARLKAAWKETLNWLNHGKRIESHCFEDSRHQL
jgi:phosphoribosylformylglycinamidine synthase